MYSLLKYLPPLKYKQKNAHANTYTKIKCTYHTHPHIHVMLREVGNKKLYLHEKQMQKHRHKCTYTHENQNAYIYTWIDTWETRIIAQSYYLKMQVTRSHSLMEGSLTNKRIRNITFNFKVIITISQNTLIPVSHVLQNLMKKLKNWPFAKIEKGQNLAKYET
mgnify:CR=1 FL=1